MEDILAQIQRDMSAIHSTYKDWFSQDAPPLIALVSPLAEGADRIAAHAALDRQIAQLDVVLPFEKDCYEKTFENDASRRGVRRTARGRARNASSSGRKGPAAGKLDAARNSTTANLELCGLTVLAQCDILIAVWDGEPPRGPGAPAPSSTRAARQCVPIIVIDPAGCKQPVVRWHGDWRFPVPAEHAKDLPALGVEENLATILEQLIRPPEDAEEIRGLQMYLDSAPSSARPGILDGDCCGACSASGDRRRRKLMSGLRYRSRRPTSNKCVETRLEAASDAANGVAEYFAHAFRTRLSPISSWRRRRLLGRRLAGAK